MNGKPIGPPIQSNDLADYYRSTIDNVFHRGLTNGQAWVCQLANDVLQGGVFTGNTLRAWGAHLDAVALRCGHVDPADGPWFYEWNRRKRRRVDAYSHMTDWTAFLAGIRRGYFRGNPATGRGAEAREAAVFIHDFVSDHLPLYVELDVP